MLMRVYTKLQLRSPQTSRLQTVYLPAQLKHRRCAFIACQSMSETANRTSIVVPLNLRIRHQSFIREPAAVTLAGLDMHVSKRGIFPDIATT